jgi:hypothetical protein
MQNPVAALGLTVAIGLATAPAIAEKLLRSPATGRCFAGFALTRLF